ncbi:hypothetical protein KIH86_09910 [Paenibacillus sp. HN-1]|uniref:hypothetical protein n=1 Tax=Paenibacillus TaxID=44249 RepID=UPI001CA855EF|nr:MULTISPECIES: hypothetical protein [Paenibacillus]MBY9079904.1 hypothetical protein [Paenibacillus sp. CGMCC 1.18879]MBY9084545.1 hypothetical protein [Paenibacillus sinensis]
MKLTIISPPPVLSVSVRDQHRPIEVHFRSPYGEGKGWWLGPVPAPGEELDVELELDGLLIRWVDVAPAPGERPIIALEEGLTVLRGTLEDIEEDGTAYLTIGESEIPFECIGEPMAVGGTVEIRTGALRLYPALHASL